MRSGRPEGPPGRVGPAGARLARREPGSATTATPPRTAATETRARPRPRPPGARAVALDVLGAVLGEERRAFDEAFQAHPALDRLAPRDRAFARLLVTTTLRRLGQIDRAVLPLLRYRPRSLAVLNTLRLGAAQLLFLGTPPHAAVGETVGLASGAHARELPMLNAVLRRVAQEGPALLEGQNPPGLNTPAWLLTSWIARYGEATARAIAEAHTREPPLDITTKDAPERWASELEAEILPTGSLRRRTAGLVESLPGFEEGAWWVQDVAATLPVRLFGALRGVRVLDIGAAPGGKTAQLCALGAEVTALERSPRRAEYLAGNLARLGLRAAITVADVHAWREDVPFDAVLLDAPCTATGTIRRHPDVPWVKSPQDVVRLAGAQARLLERAVALTRPGGRLVYAVCSLQPEEGPDQIAALLADGAPVVREPVRPEELGGLPVELTPEGEVRTLPSQMEERGGMDGFFIARLRRLA